MGIAIAGAKILLKEAAQRPLSGTALCLGKQCVYFTYEQLQVVAKEFGVTLDASVPPMLSEFAPLAALGFISDTCLFRSLGCKEVYSVDGSTFEGADFLFDMNRAAVPPELTERFDLVFDGGTIEHVFHLPNALNNIFTMLRPGGRVVHVSPSSNHLDHGFFMFSPTLFWDYYCANQFDVNSLQVFRYSPRHSSEPWEIFDYAPGCLQDVSYGGLDDAMYGVSCIAAKTPASTGTMIPMQGYYLQHWNASAQDTRHPASDPQRQLANSQRNQRALPPVEPVRRVDPNAIEKGLITEDDPVRVSSTPVLAVGSGKWKRAIRSVPPLYGLMRFCYRFVKRQRSPQGMSAELPVEPVVVPRSAPMEPARGIGIKVVARY